MSYVVAFYEVDLAFGGPEDGGWHYQTGDLARPFRICRTESRALEVARRANALLDRLQHRRPAVESVLYVGGRHRACVFERTAPSFFPAVRPRYE